LSYKWPPATHKKAPISIGAGQPGKASVAIAALSGYATNRILSKRRGQICSSRVRDSAGERRITDPP